jgi:hypothetical protein
MAGCQGATILHRPTPMRLVKHHIQPQVCGGATLPGNLATLCDSCHYSVHVLLWHLGQGTKPPAKGTRQQRALAEQGYEACQAANTVNKIPKESDL